LNINSLPLREALQKGEDQIIDSIIRKVRDQEFIKRKNYIFYVRNTAIVNNFNHQYLQVRFSEVIRNDFNFERIIFQKQFDKSMIIVLHCCYYNTLFDDNIMQSLLKIFVKHKVILDLFSQAKLIDQMYWRASQPMNNLVPLELQWSPKSNIGFCGDWFINEGCLGVEAAMKSSIRLAKFLNWN